MEKADVTTSAHQSEHLNQKRDDSCRVVHIIPIKQINSVFVKHLIQTVKVFLSLSLMVVYLVIIFHLVEKY